MALVRQNTRKMSIARHNMTPTTRFGQKDNAVADKFSRVSDNATYIRVLAM